MSAANDHRCGYAREDAPAQDAQARFRLLSESLRDAFVRVAMDGRIVECNALYCELLGYTGEELRTLTYKDLTPARWHSLEDAVVAEQILPRGQSEVYEKEYRRKDGTVIPVELRTVLERDGAGEPLAMWAIVRDIGERRRVEDKLREREARYRQLAESIPVALYTCDAEGVIDYFNDRAAELWGRRPCIGDRDEGFCGSLQLYGPDGAPLPRDRSAVAEALASGTSVRNREVTVERPDGSRVEVLVQIDPIRDPTGTVVGAINAFTDITERKRAEATLNTERTRLSQVLENLPVGVWIADATGRLTAKNRAADRIWAGDAPLSGGPEDYREYPAWDVRTGQRLETDDYPLTQTLRTGLPVGPLELRIRRLDGTEGAVSISTAPLRDGDGPPTGAIAINVDITERRQAEEKLRESEARLRLAWQATREVLWDWDIEKDEQRWNDAGVATFGWTDAVDAPQTAAWWSERVHEDDRQRVAEGFHRALSDPQSERWEDEYRFLRGDGSVADVLDRGFILRDAAGKPRRMIGAMQDITERKRTEAALDSAKTRAEADKRYLEAVLQALPVGVVVTDAQGGVVLTNRRDEDIWGARPPTLGVEDYARYRAWWADSGQPVAPYEWASARAVREGEAVLGQILEIERFDGGRRWVHNSAVPIRDERGHPMGCAVAIADITDLRRTEAALREGEARYRQLAESIPVAVYTCDAEGVIDYFNDRAAELWGRRPCIGDRDERFCGSFRLYDPDGVPLPHDRTPVAEALASGRSIRNREVTVERPDGSRVEVLVQIDPIRDAAGTLVGAINALTDITPRRRAERALRERAEEVERLLDVVPAAVWVAHDPACLTVTGNRRANELFEAAPGENLSAGAVPQARRFFAPDGCELPPDALPMQVAAATDREVRDAEIDVRLPSGRTLSLRGNAVPLRDEHGGVRGVVRAFLDVTARKRAEEALLQALAKAEAGERMLATLLASVPEGITVCDADGAILAVSQHGQNLLGGPHAGKRIEEVARDWTVYRPDGRTLLPTAELPLAQALAGATVRDLELVQIDADGRALPLICNAAPIRDAGGEVVGAVVAWRDIAERKRAAEALEAERARLQAVLDSLPVGVWIADAQATVVQSNRAAERVWGQTSRPFGLERYGDYKGWRADTGESVAPFDRALARAVLRGEGSTGEAIDIERFDGSRGTILASAAPVVDRDGQVIGGVAVAQDITEATQAKQALLRSREGLRRLAEASLSVVARTELGDMLQALAEAACALTGGRLAICAHGPVGGDGVLERTARAPGAADYPPPELSGTMFRLARGGVHRSVVEGAEALRLTDVELRAHPRCWGLPDGHAPLRGLLGVPLRARSGVTAGAILVTDRAQGDFDAEDEALLAQLATVASLALQHVEARLSLEDADRRKTAFLAMLGHELRNPLAPVVNSLYVLERAAPGGELARQAQATIERQVGHLTHLVDDLLDVTRISRGKIELRCERLDLCDLVRRAAEDYRQTFVQHRLELALSLPGDALWASADRTRIAQVVGNLLGNAAKFTPAGGTVAVALACDSQTGQAVLRVCDTGIGIAREMLARVFEPFAQADTTLERSRGGLGLGLAAVKGLVELHGGSASVESAGPGRGAEFTVRLPLDPAEPPFPTPTAQPAERGARRRVLVVEDNLDAAESLRVLLELCGHTVAVAHSGPKGVETAQDFGPDLVLCDVGLPEMDGYAVARTLRGDPALRATRLVALSGYAAPEDVAKALEAGFDAHLAKPPSLEKLQAILGETRRGEGSL